MNKIWVLFSIANDYDQPDNNLEAWWANKPSFDQLSKTMGIVVNKEKGNETLGKILRGIVVRYDGADYRLKELREGKIR